VLRIAPASQSDSDVIELRARCVDVPPAFLPLVPWLHIVLPRSCKDPRVGTVGGLERRWIRRKRENAIVLRAGIVSPLVKTFHECPSPIENTKIDFRNTMCSEQYNIPARMIDNTKNPPNILFSSETLRLSTIGP
jgi:hypothetical protein